MAEMFAETAWGEGAERPPEHVAIIMDGNGRWAQERGLPRAIGHRMGVEAVRRTIKAAIELDIKYLTLYSFSTENWSRPATEISDLMGLMKRFIRRDLAELHQSGVRIRIIGERDNVDSDLLAMIDEAVQMTASNTRLNLIIAFNYGARGEIALAARALAAQVAAGQLRPEDITPERLEKQLDTAGIPDPDLLIRTSGEERLSNFSALAVRLYRIRFPCLSIGRSSIYSCSSMRLQHTGLVIGAMVACNTVAAHDGPR